MQNDKETFHSLWWRAPVIIPLYPSPSGSVPMGTIEHYIMLYCNRRQPLSSLSAVAAREAAAVRCRPAVTNAPPVRRLVRAWCTKLGLDTRGADWCSWNQWGLNRQQFTTSLNQKFVSNATERELKIFHLCTRCSTLDVHYDINMFLCPGSE